MKMMTDQNGDTILMKQDIDERVKRLNRYYRDNFDNINSFTPYESSTKSEIDVWSQEKQTDMESHEQSKSTSDKRNCFHLVICLLLVIIGAAVTLTIIFIKASTAPSPTPTTNISTTTNSTSTITSSTSTSTITSVTNVTTTTSALITSSITTMSIVTASVTTTMSTSITSRTTTMQAAAIASSSLTSYCGCSNFTLSLSDTAFSPDNVLYQWQKSSPGQNTWSDIGTPSSLSLLDISSQVYSTDYQCQIFVLSPPPMNLTSTIVTVMTTTYSSYCQTVPVNCDRNGDNINNFILIGELGTQIYDRDTNCSAFSYDDRTQKLVILYQNKNYTAQVSTQSPSGKHLMIWIDFDDDFQFETYEQVTPLTEINSTIKYVLIIIRSYRVEARIGVHRMRVTVTDSDKPNPCSTSSMSGETHDYTVHILPPSSKL